MISKGGGTAWFDMTTTVVEDLGAMTHWHTIHTMNWRPAEAQSKFAVNVLDRMLLRMERATTPRPPRGNGIAVMVTSRSSYYGDIPTNTSCGVYA
jgi:hypothetical protein